MFFVFFPHFSHPMETLLFFYFGPMIDPFDPKKGHVAEPKVLPFLATPWLRKLQGIKATQIMPIWGMFMLRFFTLAAIHVLSFLS